MRDFTVTEAIEVYPLFRRIVQHLEDHRYVTREDYERILKEETQNQLRRDLAEIEGDIKFEINTNIYMDLEKKNIKVDNIKEYKESFCIP